MNHFAAPSFWNCYKALPDVVQKLADKNFDLLKTNPSHPSLHFKKVGRYWSVRVGIEHRAIAAKDNDAFVWFWIGQHDQYDRILR